MRCLSLCDEWVLPKWAWSGSCEQFRHCGLRKFRRIKSSVYRWYTQLDCSWFVYDTHNTMEATRSRHGWVHMFITHRPTLTLQLHNFDLFRTCRTSIFCTVVWQLARFQLTRRIAWSLGDSWASCCIFADLRANSQWRLPRKKRDIFTRQVGSTDGSFTRKPSLKRFASAVRRTSSIRTFTSYSRRESFERRFSCKETVCRPHPTPQVFQTDIESRQAHSQCHRPCQLSTCQR